MAIVLLGPLLGSSADASTAFAEHFNDNASRMRDLLGCAALLLAGAMLTWTAVTARRCTVASADNSIPDLSAAAAIVTACTFVVASALLITVPLLTTIGELTDDPGLDPGVEAGVAQAGTVEDRPVIDTRPRP